jgi:uncharacterized protein (TIGR03435 family)
MDAVMRKEWGMRLKAKVLILLLLLALLVAPAARAQSATVSAPQDAAESIVVPQFDVISVKPDKTASGMTSLRLTPDGFSAQNVAVHMLLLEGHQLNADQLVGEPAWTKNENFDIEAKVAGPDVATLGKLSFNQRRAMFRQILVEQFKLATHTETRQLPVYVLTVAKGGPKFKEHVPDPAHPERENGQGRFNVGPDRITTQGTTMAYFLSFLAQKVGRTFEDKTGLTGRYDITLKWTPDDAGGGASQAKTDGAGTSSQPADSGLSIFTAIQEQLGLKLESAKGPVQVLVIDHIERPAEN